MPPDLEVVPSPPSGDKSAAPSGPTAMPPTRSVLDCGPGGCGSGFGGWGGGWLGGLGSVITTGLDRVTIDDACTDSLMWRIVSAVVDDALGDSARPTLAGDSGELTPCLDWLDERGFWPAMRMALIYSRQYGGGGIVCFVDDGRDADDEVDVLAARDVAGFYALPKWYLYPDGLGSSRVRAGWYGPRVGRPEYYYVTSTTGLSAPPASVASLRTLEETAERTAEAAGLPRAPAMPDDVRRIIAGGGRRFHRSRIIPWPHRDDMDLRLARWMPTWMGWGPGVVEGCLQPFLARRQGALRVAAIMRSIVVNTVTIKDLEHRQTTPDMGAAIRERLEQIKWCLQFMDDALPLIATDVNNVFGSHTHSVAGLDKLLEAQRQFLLDVVDMPAVRLYGDSVGGLNGGARDGEWRQWYDQVRAYQSGHVWQAGAFGGGLKQAVSLSMICSRGPTAGRYDPTVKATWPSQWTESARDAAETRLKNAQARAQDKLTLNLTDAALRRHDPTVKRDYPSLDVDEEPLPMAPNSSPSAVAPAGSVPAVGGTGAASETPQEAAATTPGAVNKAVAAAEADPAAGGPPTEDAATSASPASSASTFGPGADVAGTAGASAESLPADIHTEAEIAAAYRLSRRRVRQVLADAGVAPAMRVPPGTAGGDRYSLAAFNAALRTGVEARADAMRLQPR